jgi:solute carrier family 35 protein E1
VWLLTSEVLSLPRPGFLAAMGSNVTFQSRNVFSKKFMGRKKARCLCCCLHALLLLS